MKRERTIVEAIEKVLKENNKGMDYREIEIIYMSLGRKILRRFCIQ